MSTTVSLIDLGHPHDTRIGERHRSVPIFQMQLAQRGDVLVDAQCDHERTIFKKPEQCIMGPGETGVQMLADSTRSGVSSSSIRSATQP